MSKKTPPKMEVVHADATKEFFIDMLTRDIPLLDCVLDLADNCIDGANRTLEENKTMDSDQKYRGFALNIKLSGREFSISDNCGGISIDLAKNKVFYFGRPKRADDSVKHGIGLYGIGMKRALFKMGTQCEVRSSTSEEAFAVVIDVPAWAEKVEWTFDLERITKFRPPGTKIVIKVLREQCASEFGETAFVTQLIRTMARDYSFFIQRGIEMGVNDTPVAPYIFKLRSGAKLEPVHYTYDDEGVRVTISAGLAALPQEEVSQGDRVSPVDYFGWFVVCNDRVVLAADKTAKTIWTDESFQAWHPQYNGFMGIISFTCDDGAKLPWATTKRDIDRSNKVFLRAVAKMKTATQQYITYSNARKQALEKAKAEEADSKPVPISSLKEARSMKLPVVAVTSPNATVSYQVSRTLLKKVANALGNPSMAASKVGSKTFDYYVENEL